MRTKFREYQKVAKSSRSSEKVKAVDRIENLLLIIITVSAFLVDGVELSLRKASSLETSLPVWMTVENVPFISRDSNHVDPLMATLRNDLKEGMILKGDHPTQHGRLVVLLQTVQLFDVMFWPVEGTSSFRNIEMLTYPKYNKRTASNKAAKYMNLLISALRISLFLFQELFPFGRPAELNFRRVVALIHAAHNDYPFVVPLGVDDWLMVFFGYTSKTLAAIRFTLLKLYKLLYIKG